MAINTEVDKLPWKIKVDSKNRQWLKDHPEYSFIPWKEYQKLHNFIETDYGVKNSEWKMLDFANPSWAPADYSQWGKNKQV